MTKSEEIQESARELAEAHWKWGRECLDKFADYDQTHTHDTLLEEMEWAFENGFIHGFKHGKNTEETRQEGGTRNDD